MSLSAATPVQKYRPAEFHDWVPGTVNQSVSLWGWLHVSVGLRVVKKLHLCKKIDGHFTFKLPESCRTSLPCTCTLFNRVDKAGEVLMVTSTCVGGEKRTVCQWNARQWLFAGSPSCQQVHAPQHTTHNTRCCCCCCWIEKLDIARIFHAMWVKQHTRAMRVFPPRRYLQYRFVLDDRLVLICTPKQPAV